MTSRYGPIAAGAAVLTLILGSCTSLQLPLAGEPADERPGSVKDFGAWTSTPAVVWQASVDALPSGAAITPDGRHVVVATRRGDLIALSAQSGRREGRVRIGRALAGAPALAGDLAVVGLSEGPSAVVAYDLRRGQTRWRRGQASGDTQVTRIADGRIVMVTGRGEVTALSAADGRAEWTVVPDSSSAYLATALEVEPHLVVASQRGLVTALDPADGATVWQRKLGGPIHHRPVAAEGMIILSVLGGGACALDATDGSTRWCLELDDPDARLSAPTLADGQVLVGSTEGLVRAVDVGTGHETWRRRVAAGVVAPPIYAGAVAIVADLRGNVTGLDMTNGETLWSVVVGGAVTSRLLLRGPSLFVPVAPRSIVALRVEGE